MPLKILQALVRRTEDGFLAECIELPLGEEAESLDDAVRALERSIQRYLEDRDAWELPPPPLAVALYFGRLAPPDY